MLACSRRNLGHGGCNCRGTPLGNPHAIGSGRIGGAQDGFEIVWIFDSVQHYDERMFAASRGDDVVEIAVLLRRSRGYQTLMRRVPGNFVQLLARHDAHRDADLAALVDYAAQKNIFAFFGDTYPLEISSSGLEGLGHCIDSEENVHED